MSDTAGVTFQQSHSLKENEGGLSPKARQSPRRGVTSDSDRERSEAESCFPKSENPLRKLDLFPRTHHLFQAAARRIGRLRALFCKEKPLNTTVRFRLRLLCCAHNADNHSHSWSLSAAQHVLFFLLIHYKNPCEVNTQRRC